MTKLEAEKQYKIEVQELIIEHKRKMKNLLIFFLILAPVLLITGTILLIIGLKLNSEGRYESDEIFFIFTLISFFFMIILSAVGLPLTIRAIKKGPKSFLYQNKNLYLNYLRCTDISNEDKLYYTQKLEEIRNMELCSSISAAARDIQ